MSEATTLEVTSVLLRSKFDRYLSSDVRERFLTVFLQQTALVEIIESITTCRDPKDDKFLEVAVHGNANLIIKRTICGTMIVACRLLSQSKELS